MRLARLVGLSGVYVALLGVLVVGVAVHRSSPNTDTEARRFDKRYMERDGAPVSGHDAADNQTENNRTGEEEETGRLRGAIEKYLARAYPAFDVSAAQTELAQQTWSGFKENAETTGPNNRNHPFRWEQVGPIHATMPGILTFSGAQYRTSGRATALAITPTCTNARCTLWLGAAGGGIWRTDNPLSPDPKWYFVSGSFGTNAIGTLDQDPSDPRGMTLYAGTGEPNASGDSEAGVGIYKTTDGGATWTRLPGSVLFTTRAIGKIAIDPRNPRHLFVGVARGIRGYSSVTGGAFSRTGACQQVIGGLACGDGPDQAPLGLYESIDGGTTFTLAWNGGGSIRGVTDVGLDPINPDVVYASAFQFGIWRRDPTKGETTFQQVFATRRPTRNDSRTQFDLTAKDGHTRIYASDGAVGAVFVNAGTPPVPTEVPLTASTVWRVDNADTFTSAALLASEALPRDGVGWDVKSSDTDRPRSAPYRESYDFCTGQCWYDQDVYTPKGHPDIVYLIGSYSYGELYGPSNGRGVLLSTTAGEPNPALRGSSWNDMTWDHTPEDQPDQLHPDHHEIITPANDPFMFFSASDGGIVRSDGSFDDASDACSDPRAHPFNRTPDDLALCRRLLSRVPHQLFDVANKGLSTLQFQSVAIHPKQPLTHVQGGTQDNGTFEWTGAPTQWWMIMYGDGGNGGYNHCDPTIRFNEFTGQATDTNFHNGMVKFWTVTSGPMFFPQNGGEVASFYAPIVADEVNCGSLADFPQFQTETARALNTNNFAGRPGPPAIPATPAEGRVIGDKIGFMYTGMNHVWRTIDNGGPQDYLESNCPEFFTSAADPRCGNWKPLGGPPGFDTPGDLTGAFYGAPTQTAPDRFGGTVVQVERNPADRGTIWAATSPGRVFITRNANAVDPDAVQWCRIDNRAAPFSPPRFVSSIHADPSNPNRAYLAYNGYNSNTRDQPGHVFEVTLTEPTGCAGPVTWRDLLVEQGSIPDGREGDIPIVDLVRDDLTGDLYASTDFGVLRGARSGATYTWARVGVGLPRVETPGITIDSCSRVLYAATHGRSVYRMFLGPVANAPKDACPRTP